MTREEAMKELSYIADEMPSMECANWIEAISMAIKALEQEPCGDAISRQAVLEIVEREQNKGDALFGIEQLPPVTPAEKVGQWIDIMVGDMPAQACNRCNTFYPLSYTGGGHRYCPNCGAKMQEVNK